MTDSIGTLAPPGLAVAPRAGAHPCPRRAGQRGFTLIEVLVALIVLVLGVLGAAAMTLNSLRDNKQSALRSQASALAYELGDLMRANAESNPDPTAQAARELIFTSAPAAVVSSCYASGCLPSEMAASDFAQWVAKLTAATGPVLGLPGASYRICRDVANLNSMTSCDNLITSPLVVKLKWNERFNNGTYVADQTGGASKPNLVLPVQPY